MKIIFQQMGEIICNRVERNARRRRSGVAGLAIAALLFAGWGLNSVAQSTATAPTQASSTAAPLVRTSASLVLVDVVVTNNGNPVHGLDRGQFRVLEDGQEQPIASFEEHRPVDAASVHATRPALAPNTYTNLPVYPQASAVNVLLLDGLNTPMANQMNVRRKMLEYVGKIPPGTSLAVFTLASRLRMVQGFTADPAELAKALESAKAAPQSSVILDPASDQALDTTIGDMANMASGPTIDVGGVTALSSMRQFQADLTAYQTDMRVRMTLDAMQQLARYLSGIPGRKNVIWFSGSFPIALDPDDSQDNAFEAMRTYSNDIRDTAELLAASRVAIYPVDARGLMTPPSLDASYAPATNLIGATTSGNRSAARSRVTANKPSVANDVLNAQKQLMAEQAVMQQIAEQTGGKESLNTNGLKEAVASAIENGSSYYTIGYVPAARPLDGQFRKIAVSVDNRNLKLAYRHGYYADPADKLTEHTPGQVSLITAATLHGAPPSTQILFEARVLPATDAAFEGAKLPGGPAGELTAGFKTPAHRMMTDLKIDAHTLAYDSAADGAIHSKVEFTLVAYDDEGKRVNYFDSGFQLSLKAGQVAQTMENGIRLRLPLDLPAGRFFVRIAVHDLAAGRAGSLEVPVVVPND